MKLFVGLTPLFIAIVAPTPGTAMETTYSYTGTVTATPDTSQSFDLKVGSTVSFLATFDPDTLIDRSQTFYNVDAISGQAVAINGLRTTSLFDDPNASLTLTAGSHTLTIADDPDAGNDSLGVGAQPVAIFQNSTFAGVAFAGAASDGFFIDIDPIAKALHYFPTTGVGYDYNSADPDYGFLLKTNLPELRVSPVPEPATWITMIAGLCGIGGLMRRGQAGRTLPNAEIIV